MPKRKNRHKKVRLPPPLTPVQCQTPQKLTNQTVIEPSELHRKESNAQGAQSIFNEKTPEMSGKRIGNKIVNNRPHPTTEITPPGNSRGTKDNAFPPPPQPDDGLPLVAGTQRGQIFWVGDKLPPCPLPPDLPTPGKLETINQFQTIAVPSPADKKTQKSSGGIVPERSGKEDGKPNTDKKTSNNTLIIVQKIVQNHHHNDTISKVSSKKSINHHKLPYLTPPEFNINEKNPKELSQKIVQRNTKGYKKRETSEKLQILNSGKNCGNKPKKVTSKIDPNQSPKEDSKRSLGKG